MMVLGKTAAFERLEYQVELDAVDKEVPRPPSYMGTSLKGNTPS